MHHLMEVAVVEKRDRQPMQYHPERLYSPCPQVAVHVQSMQFPHL